MRSSYREFPPLPVRWSLHLSGGAFICQVEPSSVRWYAVTFATYKKITLPEAPRSTSWIASAPGTSGLPRWRLPGPYRRGRYEPSLQGYGRRDLQPRSTARGRGCFYRCRLSLCLMGLHEGCERNADPELLLRRVRYPFSTPLFVGSAWSTVPQAHIALLILPRTPPPVEYPVAQDRTTTENDTTSRVQDRSEAGDSLTLIFQKSSIRVTVQPNKNLIPTEVASWSRRPSLVDP
ncbi:hypothetical protein MBBA_1461 [Methanoculleus bourgensis]|jgi:hypothetical protein|nr:hypothetical protein MBBA_1461 [Methanoculleus bourgensis]